MGSTIDTVKCPKCGHETFTRDYYYRSSEEFCFCSTCGYERNVFLKRDEETGKYVKEVTQRYDLNKVNIIFGQAKHDKDNVKKIVGMYNSKRMTPEDTDEDIFTFINLHLCFEPFNKKQLPEKFNMITGTMPNDRFSIFLEENGEYTQLFYINRELKIVDGHLEVHEVPYIKKESGGFGVVSVKAERGWVSYSIEEGTVPEITDDVVFASAVIDGELKILKNSFNN